MVPAGRRAHEASKVLKIRGAKDVDPFLTHREREVLLQKFGCETPIAEVNLNIDVGCLVGQLSCSLFALQKRDAFLFQKPISV